MKSRCMGNKISNSGSEDRYLWWGYEKKMWKIMISILLFSLLQCGTPSVSGGTDFPNTRTVVVGRIINKDGSAGSTAIVQMIPDDYNPFMDSTVLPSVCTDSSGHFSLDINDSGSYNLYAVHSHKGTRLMVRSIEVNNQKDTVRVGERVLGQTGAVMVVLPESASITEGYVYLQGTPFSVPVTEEKRYVIFDSVPTCTVLPIYLAEKKDQVPLLIQDSAEAHSGDTTVIAPDGRFFVKLFLNTTESGAYIREDVYTFPVAIRFASLSLPMEEMRSDGSDLLITDRHMKPLPTEIENWDTTKSDALIWVLVDTVFGDNAEQFFYLFWGKDRNNNEGYGNVFDPAKGFSAVWHLNGKCNDVTGNGFHSEFAEQVKDTTGILGGAKQFYGNNSIVIPGLLDTPLTVTLSAWAKLDTVLENGAEIVSIGDAVLIRMDDNWNNKGCQGSFYSYPDSVDTLTHAYLSSGRFLARSGWHFFCYVVDNQNMTHRFYIDGELSSERQMTVPIFYSGIGSSVIIGDHGNSKKGWNFKGCIDEVRVDHTVRSASWIRLCYVNQHYDSKLVSAKQ